MATLQEKANFMAGMAGYAQDIGKKLAQREARAQVLEGLVGEGLDSSRDELREAMTFSVKRRDGKGEVQSMDERGQRKSIETEDARTKYESLDPKVSKRVTDALGRIIKLKDQMAAAEDKDGTKVFSTQDIIDELFTPLIREGLLPETLVIDGYSEVAIMLREVMGSFRGMLKKQEEDKRKAAAKAEADYHNAGTKMDVVKGFGAKAMGFAQSQVDVLAGKVGMTPEELMRAKIIAMKSAATAKSVYGAYKAGVSLDKTLDGTSNPQLLSTKIGKMHAPTHLVSSALAPVIGQLKNIPEGPLTAVLAEVEKQVTADGLKMDDFVRACGDRMVAVLTKFAKLIESDGVNVARDVVKVLSSGISGGIGLGVAIGGRVGTEGDIDKAVRRGELRSGANELVDGIEQALRTALLPYSPAASDAVGGAFASGFDADALVDIVEPALSSAPDTPPQPKAIITLIGKAMEAAIGKAHRDLKPFGEAVAKAYEKGTGSEVTRLGGLFKKGSLADPGNIFALLVAPAADAAASVFKTTEFAQAIAGDEVGEKLSTAAREQNAGQEQELDEANDELDDFERQLVLIDEGGMALARQQSLDVLIAQIKADQRDLEIVLKVGALLSGAGGAITKLGVDSKNVSVGQHVAEQVAGTVAKTAASQVADSLMPALQAAQLVMKMSVTIVKIARRAELASKFKADVGKARKAGSMLMPSIENFYSAKVTQQIYASIELALQTVQLAGTICSSVPEPITMAVGKALTAASQAAEAGRDLAKTTQDEVMLRKGWKITLAAMNNPANRRAGLDALRHNATLAVHSIAWAATNGDPMAREILRSCGVTAQSLADSESDKDKVIEYLETLLDEDLRFKDARKVKLDWAPEPLQLSYAGWFTLKKRARGASPPLSEDATAEIDGVLRQLDLQPRIHNIQAHPDQYDETTLEAFRAQAQKAAKLLGDYKPLGSDRTPHGDMKLMSEKLRAQAEERTRELAALVEEAKAPVVN